MSSADRNRTPLPPVVLAGGVPAGSEQLLWLSTTYTLTCLFLGVLFFLRVFFRGTLTGLNHSQHVALMWI